MPSSDYYQYHKEEGFCDYCTPTLKVLFNKSAFKEEMPTIEKIRKKYELKENEIDPKYIQVLPFEGKVWVRIAVKAARRLERQNPPGFVGAFQPSGGGQPGGP